MGKQGQNGMAKVKGYLQQQKQAVLKNYDRTQKENLI